MMIAVRKILLQALCLLYLASQGCSQHVIQQRKPQQCFTDTEKVAQLKCKLFMAENDLEECRMLVSELTTKLGEVKEVIQCGMPPLPNQNGSYTHEGTSFDDRAKYTCEEGYQLDGEPVIRCEARGKWGKAPCCRKDTTNITLETVNWCCGRVSDTEFGDKVQNLSGYVGELWLSQNSLTQIPALGEYHQLDTVSKLYLYYNNIRSFSWDDIPINVSVLSLQYNELSTLPVVGEAHRCLRVRTLYLHQNNIRTLEARQLPVTVTVLWIGHNKLTSVGDLSSLPLSTLDLSNNLLTEVNRDYLPVTLSKLWLLGDRITVSGGSHLVNLFSVIVSRGNEQYYRERFPQADVRGLH